MAKTFLIAAFAVVLAFLCQLVFPYLNTLFRENLNTGNRMIRFVKNQKEGVSAILVYSLDRFSRTGDNAIFISAELKRQGISILSVTQPIDVSTHSGVLQQNIQFIFSKYDNDLRREKCIAGMKEKLLRGEWTGVAPMGYYYDQTGRIRKIIAGEKGKLIARAFEMKVEGLTNTEIAAKLSKLGLRLDKKRLSDVFRNPDDALPSPVDDNYPIERLLSGTRSRFRSIP